jgi:hypothetical protein
MRAIDELIETLIEVTEAEKLKWERDGPSRSSFRARLGKRAVAIWEWSDPEEGIAGITLQLLDAKDQVLDAAQADEYGKKYTRLRLMFDVARRSAFDVDAVIGELQDELAAIKKN